MKSSNTLNTLRHLEKKIRLIRAIHLYKLKFENLSPEKEQSTRYDLSTYDLLLEEIEEHILALTTILKILGSDLPENQKQEQIRPILFDLPVFSREMNHFVVFLDEHNQQLSTWLNQIVQEYPAHQINGKTVPQAHIRFTNQKSAAERSQIVESFKNYSKSISRFKTFNLKALTLLLHPIS